MNTSNNRPQNRTNSLDETFFSKKNFTLLYSVLKQKIKGDTKIDITNKKSENYPRKLYHIMKNMHRDKHKLQIPENSSVRVQVQSLNKHVLSFIIPFVNDTLNMESKGGDIPRDFAVNERVRPINTMDFPKLIQKNSEKVNADFDKIQQSRDIPLPQRPSLEQFQQQQTQRDFRLRKIQEQSVPKFDSLPRQEMSTMINNPLERQMERQFVDTKEEALVQPKILVSDQVKKNHSNFANSMKDFQNQFKEMEMSDVEFKNKLDLLERERTMEFTKKASKPFEITKKRDGEQGTISSTEDIEGSVVEQLTNPNPELSYLMQSRDEALNMNSVENDNLLKPHAILGGPVAMDGGILGAGDGLYGTNITNFVNSVKEQFVNGDDGAGTGDSITELTTPAATSSSTDSGSTNALLVEINKSLSLMLKHLKYPIIEQPIHLVEPKFFYVVANTFNINTFDNSILDNYNIDFSNQTISSAEGKVMEISFNNIKSKIKSLEIIKTTLPNIAEVTNYSYLEIRTSTSLTGATKRVSSNMGGGTDILSRVSPPMMLPPKQSTDSDYKPGIDMVIAPTKIYFDTSKDIPKLNIQLVSSTYNKNGDPLLYEGRNDTHLEAPIVTFASDTTTTTTYLKLDLPDNKPYISSNGIDIIQDGDEVVLLFKTKNNNLSIRNDSGPGTRSSVYIARGGSSTINPVSNIITGTDASLQSGPFTYYILFDKLTYDSNNNNQSGYPYDAVVMPTTNDFGEARLTAIKMNHAFVMRITTDENTNYHRHTSHIHNGWEINKHTTPAKAGPRAF